jgi:UDP-N-acetylglucosamine 2-epimerase (hydrolysing)
MNRSNGVALNKKKILFLTGTRADFGKLKPLITAVRKHTDFDYMLFVTGMHTLAKYGFTADEVINKSGFNNSHMFMNQIQSEPMEMVLANTIGGLSRFTHEYHPDMIIVHGDRVEALAGAIVGALNNILVAHVEGGEVSGTVDELIRHSVSKMSHLHFVSNNEASGRLVQMGERKQTVFVIGSPDVDIMLSSGLPTLKDARKRYGIRFGTYAIAALHSVTTELDRIREQARIFVETIKNSNDNFVLIFPNNDLGCDEIFNAYRELENNNRFKIFPSIRFEYFLTLLKHSRYIIGNSSAGVREAPIFAVPAINLGTRQSRRCEYRSIINCPFEPDKINNAIEKVKKAPAFKPDLHFGKGDSVKKFMEIITRPAIWSLGTQKQFCDREIGLNDHAQ